MIKIIIHSDFSDSPGARYIKDGPFSGEEFFDNHLLPKFQEAIDNNEKLVIDLDGVWGYPSSFVSGSFGKLSIQFGAEKVLNTIEFISNESLTRKERIISEIKMPTRK